MNITPAQLRAALAQAAQDGAAAALAATGKHTRVSAPVREFPKNVNGITEYGLVQLTLDHLSAESLDGHVRTKFVMSTESVVEGISNLMAYYQIDPAIAGGASTYEKIAAAGRGDFDNAILIFYAPEGNPHDDRQGPVFEVLMTTPFYDNVVMHEDWGLGSSFMATQQLIKTVAGVFSKADGNLDTLTLITVSDLAYPQVEPLEDNPCEAMSDIPDEQGTSPRARCEGEAGNEFTGGQDFQAADTKVG